MASIASQLDLQKERDLTSLFPLPVRLHLLYKGSHHGFEIDSLMNPVTNLDKVGGFVILVFLSDGVIRGGYMSQPPGENCADNGAFLFEVKECAQKYGILDPSKAVTYENGAMVSFGGCLILEKVKFTRKILSFCDGETYKSTGWKSSSYFVDVELHRVENAGGVPELVPWREMLWYSPDDDDEEPFDKSYKSLRENVVSFKPACQSLERVRVLLLGPAGSGGSSFINSVRSVLYGQISRMSIFGPAVHRKLRSFEMKSERGGEPTALTLVDVLALGDSIAPGLTASDALAVIKGHAPEGTMFQSDAPITAQSEGYRSNPTFNEKIHCVVFVLDACKISTYSDELQSTIREIQAGMSQLTPDVAQMVLLTHVDQVCIAINKDVTSVYTSRTLQDKMLQAAEMMRLPLSFVFPVKNYFRENSVDHNTDILLLTAVKCILNTVDDVLEDYE